jgi:hypothetical protein
MTIDTLLLLFWSGLGATLVTLAAAMLLGHKHKVNAHIGAVVAFVLLLVVTLYFAVELGTRFDFEETPQKIHRTLAYLATVGLLAPLGTGVQHWRGRATRDTHKKAVTAFLVIAVATIATGMWMFNGRTPKATLEPTAAPEPIG